MTVGAAFLIEQSRVSKTFTDMLSPIMLLNFEAPTFGGQITLSGFIICSYSISFCCIYLPCVVNQWPPLLHLVFVRHGEHFLMDAPGAEPPTSKTYVVVKGLICLSISFLIMLRALARACLFCGSLIRRCIAGRRGKNKSMQVEGRVKGTGHSNACISLSSRIATIQRRFRDCGNPWNFASITFQWVTYRSPWMRISLIICSIASKVSLCGF